MLKSVLAYKFSEMFIDNFLEKIESNFYSSSSKLTIGRRFLLIVYNRLMIVNATLIDYNELSCTFCYECIYNINNKSKRKCNDIELPRKFIEENYL